VKFHNQFELTPIAVPFVLACSGRISGTYTHGTQFMVAPNANMYVKKNAIAPDANLAPLAVPSAWDSREATNIMEMPMNSDPHIIVDRRPIRSSAREGMSEPSGNMS